LHTNLAACVRRSFVAVGRGAAWQLGIGQAPLPLRRAFVELDPGNGFRCVYEAPR